MSERARFVELTVRLGFTNPIHVDDLKTVVRELLQKRFAKTTIFALDARDYTPPDEPADGGA